MLKTTKADGRTAVLLALLGTGLPWLAGCDAYQSRQHTQKAMEHFKHGDIDGALKCVDEAIRHDPKSAAHYEFRAKLHLIKGNARGAIADAQKAVALAPTNKELHNLNRVMPTLAYWCNVIRATDRIAQAKVLPQMIQKLHSVAETIEGLEAAAVDADAVQAGLQFAAAFRSLAQGLEYGNSPERLIEALVRGLHGDPFGTLTEVAESETAVWKQVDAAYNRMAATRAILSSRYNYEFPFIGRKQAK